MVGDLHNFFCVAVTSCVLDPVSLEVVGALDVLELAGSMVGAVKAEVGGRLAVSGLLLPPLVGGRRFRRRLVRFFVPGISQD